MRISARTFAAGLLALAAVAGAHPAEKFITVASTTSTEQSGLFDYLLPKFSEQTGIEVRVIAQGTGQALKTAERGDADVVFVHDPAATRAVEETIRLCHADGMTILMTTHDLGQARRLADEILFLHQGRLVEGAPAPKFFEEPRTAEAQVFLRGDLLW